VNRGEPERVERLREGERSQEPRAPDSLSFRGSLPLGLSMKFRTQPRRKGGFTL